MSQNIRSTSRIDVGGLPITGNGYGNGFEACDMPVSLEEGAYPHVLRSFVARDDVCIRRELDTSERAATVARGMKSAIAKAYPNNKELHVKRERSTVYVYKMRID